MNSVFFLTLCNFYKNEHMFIFPLHAFIPDHQPN
jgi:hypothetical protein